MKNSSSYALIAALILVGCGGPDEGPGFGSGAKSSQRRSQLALFTEVLTSTSPHYPQTLELWREPPGTELEVNLKQVLVLAEGRYGDGLEGADGMPEGVTLQLRCSDAERCPGGVAATSELRGGVAQPAIHRNLDGLANVELVVSASAALALKASELQFALVIEVTGHAPGQGATDAPPTASGDWSICHARGISCATTSSCVGDIQAQGYALACAAEAPAAGTPCNYNGGRTFRQCALPGAGCAGQAPGWQFCGFPGGSQTAVWHACERIPDGDQQYVATVLGTSVDALFSCSAPAAAPAAAPADDGTNPPTTGGTFAGLCGSSCNLDDSSCIGRIAGNYGLHCVADGGASNSACDGDGSTFRQCRVAGGCGGWQFCFGGQWQPCEAIAAESQAYIGNVLGKTPADLFTCR